MSKKKRNQRKKDPAAGKTEDADSLLEAFDIQTETLIKQVVKQFEKEAKLLMNALPLKSSIPKEVLKMELTEFIRRGGTFQAVWESIKKNDPCLTETECSEKNETSGPDKDLFITPSMSTRSQRARTRRGETTAKRKPKPLEEVKVQAFSNVSGSPVDERMLLHLHSEEIIGDIQDQLLEATAKFPQKWRSKLVQSFKAMKAQASLKDDVLVTPALRR